MSNTKNRGPSRICRRRGSYLLSYNINSNYGSNSIFSQALRRKATQNQNSLLTTLETLYRNSTNRVSLYNSDFTQGTYRITKPGVYVLRENIVFNPINIFPTEAQAETYPTGKNGPYHLGFFAALTVEAENVIIDLNGFSMIQGKRHNLAQRFFSIIELASSPFIPKQGPHSFTDSITSANTCLIMNGGLLNSSHHGVHSNNAKNVVLQNLLINDYEVAGIALNGSTNSVISGCRLIGNNNNIPVLSSFSQAIFTRRVLEQLGETNSDVYTNLNNDIETAFSEVLNNKPQTTYFENKTRKYDGNMYGIVLNVNGIVINEFLSSRENLVGNSDILVYNTSIRDVETHPVEIVAFPKDKNSITTSAGAYGSKRQVGAFGDVVDVATIMDAERRYSGNSLSNAQFYLAENYPNTGTINISEDVLNWSQNNTPLPADCVFVPEGDSMGHFMKGNIGVFVSGGTNIVLDSILINGVITRGSDVGTSPLLEDDQRYFQGSNAYGILQTASQNLVFSNVTIARIINENPGGEAENYKIITK